MVKSTIELVIKDALPKPKIRSWSNHKNGWLLTETTGVVKNGMANSIGQNSQYRDSSNCE